MTWKSRTVPCNSPACHVSCASFEQQDLAGAIKSVEQLVQQVWGLGSRILMGLDHARGGVKTFDGDRRHEFRRYLIAGFVYGFDVMSRAREGRFVVVKIPR